MDRAQSPSPEPVTIDGKRYRPVREGLASILAPYQEAAASAKKGHNNDEGSQAVFYNPIQQFNRDLTVLAILIYGEGALASKAANESRKSHGRKARNKKKHAEGNSNGGEKATESKKRKADEVDQGTELESLKRARTEDRADSDEVEIQTEEIEVAQLNGGADPRDTVIAQENGRKIPFTILDALSATGLRALRYAKEIPFATNIVANDMSKDAVQSIELNIDHNKVGEKVHSNVGDARSYMYSKVGNERQQPSDKYVHRFDVVDLDPYGTAAPFVDAALQSVVDGGLLCVTCTDAGVFASVGYLEKTYALYGGLPVKGAHCHEAGLRLIISSIATTAAKYGIAIEPLLSLSIDFYARIFIRVHKRPSDVKLLAGTTMLTYTCDQGCGAWTTQPLARNTSKEDRAGNVIYKHSFSQAPTVPPNCTHCGFKMHLGGPMWAGPLHNPYFIQRLLDRLPSLDTAVYGTIDRLRGMLTVALEEDLTLATSNTPANTSAPRSSEPSTHTTPATASLTDAQQIARLIPRVPPATLDRAPFFLIPNYLAKVLHAQTPGEDALRGALRSLGYRCTRSHCKAGSIKTDAPWDVLWEVMREWVRQRNPLKEGAVKPGMPGWRILRGVRGSEAKKVDEVRMEAVRGLEGLVNNVGGAGGVGGSGKNELVDVLKAALWRVEHEIGEAGERGYEDAGPKAEAEPKDGELKVVFDEELGKEKPRGKLVRYQINPRENWGPMNRAGGS